MKKTVIIIVSIVLVFAIAAGGTYLWAAKNPEITLNVSKPVDKTDIYIESLSTGYSEKLNIPISKNLKSQLNELYEAVNSEYEKLAASCEAPTHIELELSKADDGKTVVTYKGTITEDGITKEYSKQMTFDYKHKGEFAK
ncbi:MAG: hypothetical protein ACI4KI_04870 [Candidatus Fimenecus sp.]